MLLGGYPWHGRIHLLVEMGTSNKYKDILADHLYPMMITFLSWEVSSRITMPPYTGHEGLRKAWMSMKMMSPNFKPFERLWKILDWRVRHCSLSQSSKHQLMGCILEECVIPSVRFQRRVDSMPKCTEAVLVAHGSPICHLMVVLYRFDFPVFISSSNSHVVRSI